MKKLSLVLVLMSLVACSPEDGMDGVDGIDGEDGYNSLVVVLPSNFCSESGGVVIHSGLDRNRNDVLEESEYTYTGYVCDGIDGQDGEDGQDGISPPQFILNKSVTQEATYSCGLNDDESPVGGVEISYGYDNNANGALDDDEVIEYVLVCNGIDGSDGEDGVNGSNTLISMDTFEPGDECEFGGFAINYGYDTNANGVLDTEEVIETLVNCTRGFEIDESISIHGTWIPVSDRSGRPISHDPTDTSKDIVIGFDWRSAIEAGETPSENRGSLIYMGETYTWELTDGGVTDIYNRYDVRRGEKLSQMTLVIQHSIHPFHISAISGTDPGFFSPEYRYMKKP